MPRSVDAERWGLVAVTVAVADRAFRPSRSLGKTRCKLFHGSGFSLWVNSTGYRLPSLTQTQPPGRTTTSSLAPPASARLRPNSAQSQ